MRAVRPLHAEDSLRRAAAEFRDSGLPALPVAEGHALSGMVTELDVARALAAGLSPNDPLGQDLLQRPVIVGPAATGAEALRIFASSHASVLVVVDDLGLVAGVLTPSDLVGPPRQSVRPRMVGGMATPFGVYLTNGVVSGGVGAMALASTGMLLFALFLAASFVAAWPTEAIAKAFPAMADSLVQPISGALLFAIFLGGMRAMPLAGIHAAEHMVVHAIERGEELVPEVVSRMPRVHPRCGTNIAAGATLFMGIANSSLVADNELRLLLAAIITLLFWRPLGTMLQFYVTTKPPSRAQIEGGIRAGRELLSAFERTGAVAAGPATRLWNSGLPQIMGGSLLVSLIAEVIARTVWGTSLGVY